MFQSIVRGLVCFLIWPLLASAGGGPETTLVVVNARSALSARIANEYMQLRNIPDTHLLWLDGVPSMGVISIEDFRNKIWSPVRDFMHSHQLDEEIDLIAYSSDFPYAVDFSSDIKARKLGKSIYRGTIASLTALTYFARRVEAGDIGYLGRNYYFRDFAGPKRSPSKNHPVSRPRLGRDDVRQLKSEARRYLNRNDPGRAAETYRTIVDSYPRDPVHVVVQGIPYTVIIRGPGEYAIRNGKCWG